MRRINLWGLPCSGTTIIVRYLHSLPNAYFMSEPLSEIRAKGYVDPFPGRTLDEVFSDHLDIEIGGFKECFGTDYLQEFRGWRDKTDWEFVSILRDPLATWGSFVKKGWDPTNKTQLGIFLLWLQVFMKEVDGYPSIIYGNFVANPVAEINRVLKISVPAPLQLKKMTRRFGSSKAHHSTDIEPQLIHPISEENRAEIVKSEGYSIYLDRLNETEGK